jgi:potassium voltage-gated channel Shab-related subfamily B member 1
VKFLKGAMNIIDCLAIAPYFLTLFFMPPTELGGLGGDDMVGVQSPQLVAAAASDEPPAEDQEEDGGIGEVGRIMQVFRIARIMRIFKLARRSVGLQSIAYTVRTSWKGKNFDDVIIQRTATLMMMGKAMALLFFA